jgi:hypothetical protein
MTKYVATVNNPGGKDIIVSAQSEEEANKKLVEAWGKSNIISPAVKPQPGQIEAIQEGYNWI